MKEINSAYVITAIGGASAALISVCLYNLTSTSKQQLISKKEVEQIYLYSVEVMIRMDLDMQQNDEVGLTVDDLIMRKYGKTNS